MILLMVILLILLTLFGLPIYAGIMAAAMLGLYASGIELSAIPIEIYRLANAPVLLAIRFKAAVCWLPILKSNAAPANSWTAGLEKSAGKFNTGISP